MKIRLAKKIDKKLWQIGDYYCGNGRVKELIEKNKRYHKERNFNAFKKLWYYNLYLQEKARLRIDRYEGWSKYRAD